MCPFATRTVDGGGARRGGRGGLLRSCSSPIGRSAPCSVRPLLGRSAGGSFGLGFPRDLARTVCALEKLLHLCEHLCELVGLGDCKSVECYGRMHHGTGGVYLCGPLRPLQFCDMIPRLLRKIGGVCPCAGPPKEKGHVVGRRCGRWARGGVDGGRTDFLNDNTDYSVPKRLLTECDGVTCCHRPWQGSPDAQTNRKMPAPDSWDNQAANGKTRWRWSGDVFRGLGCKTLERGACTLQGVSS